MTSRSKRFEQLPDNLLAGEFAEYTRLAPETVYQMVRDGRIRALQGTGRRVVIPRSELLRLAEGDSTPGTRCEPASVEGRDSR